MTTSGRYLHHAASKPCSLHGPQSGKPSIIQVLPQGQDNLCSVAASISVNSCQVHPSSSLNLVNKAAVRSTPRHESGGALSGRALHAGNQHSSPPPNETWHKKECPAASWRHSGRAARSCCLPRQRPGIGLCTRPPFVNGSGTPNKLGGAGAQL
jgi:hypothetical protein